MAVTYLNVINEDDIKVKKIDREFFYYLNQKTLGPFDKDVKEIKEFLKDISLFTLEYNFKTYVPHNNVMNYECYHWSIIQQYSFTQRAHFILTIDTKKLDCIDKADETISGLTIFISKLLWIHIIVFLLSSFSFALTWKYIYKIAKLYWRLKHQLKSESAVGLEMDDLKENKVNFKKADEMKNADNNNSEDDNDETNKNEFQSKWDQLKFQDKSKLFNKWSIICLLGNIIQMFGSILSLLDYHNINGSTDMLIGFGCMLAFINIGRYLDYNKDYSTIYSTITRSLPNIIKYVLGVLPIFFGFIFFGLCLFWKSERFNSTSMSMMTLFAVLNGDSVFDVFNDLSTVNFFLGQIYMYSFCIVFIV